MQKVRIWIGAHKKFCLVILVLIIAGISAGGTYLWIQRTAVPEDTEVARVAEIEKELKDEIKKVGELVELPKNEEPVTATVSDKSALEGQEFFQEAVNGDRVLMYPKAKQAYLYRPSENRVVAMAPLEFKNQEEKPQLASGSAEASPSAAIAQ